MSQLKNAVKSIMMIVVFSLGSKMLGFLREVLIAQKFGSGPATDTFFIAVTAINLLTMLFKRSLSTTIVPILSKVEADQGVAAKTQFVNKALNMMMILSISMIAVTWALSPFGLRILALGFEGEQYQLAVQLTRIGLPMVFFASIVGVFRGFLQSRMLFREYALTDVPLNVVYILFLVFLSSTYGIKGLMAAGVLAVACQVLIQIPGLLKAGYYYQPILDFQDQYVREMFALMPPVLMIVAMNDLNRIVDRALASTLVEGSISALNYGHRLESLVVGVFITAIATVIFPILSKEAHKPHLDGLKRVMRHGVNTILLITIPAMTGMIVLAYPIVQIAFERGAFDARATQMTAGALSFYALGIPGLALRTYLSKVYYALHDTKTPMFNSIITVCLNIALNLVLVRVMGHRGLALGTSISATFTTIFLLYGLKRKIGRLGMKGIAVSGGKALAASAVMGAAVVMLFSRMAAVFSGNALAELVVLLMTVSLGMILYVILLIVFRTEELGWMIKAFKKSGSSSHNR
ncbi:MAG: murein biosynthesis integral membrane protein MurJ [Bacillota bacterium]|nr:murein biosynthesis integral membrane protein MurJ [Bacillota bacterium]MDW7676587.1 murein biosynthesis integral membrane protein MurJ [Bacillota bacterium]